MDHPSLSKQTHHIGTERATLQQPIAQNQAGFGTAFPSCGAECAQHRYGTAEHYNNSTSVRLFWFFFGDGNFFLLPRQASPIYKSLWGCSGPGRGCGAHPHRTECCRMRLGAGPLKIHFPPFLSLWFWQRIIQSGSL